MKQSNEETRYVILSNYTVAISLEFDQFVWMEEILSMYTCEILWKCEFRLLELPITTKSYAAACNISSRKFTNEVK